MSLEETFLIFAYGSNMSTARLQDRVPSARAAGIGQLKRFSLRWHKRGRDGSGKCHARATTLHSDVVWGVLFEISRSDKPRLDKAEGLGRGYEEKEVDVTTDLGEVRALMYSATDLERSLLPFHWYKDFVVSGAREHGLPVDYIRNLEKVRSAPDPEARRAARNSEILVRRLAKRDAFGEP